MTTTLQTPVPAPPQRPAGSHALVWTGGIVGGLVLLVGGYSAVGGLVAANADPSTTAGTATYAAARTVELVADGDITVESGGSDVVVRREYRSAISTPHYRSTVDGDRLLVEHTCDWWSPGSCRAALHVQVPQGTEVVVRASDGDVSATGLHGALTVRASDGATNVSEHVGDVTVRSGDGRVDLGAVDGSVHVTSADGSVRLVGVTGSATVRVSDGDVRVAQVDGDVDAQASDGDVTVFGPGVPVALDIATRDGRQTVTGPTDPSSSTRVRIRTSDGDAAFLGPNG